MTDKEAFDLIAAHAVPGAPSVETIVALKSDEQASLSPGAYQVLTSAIGQAAALGPIGRLRYELRKTLATCASERCAPEIGARLEALLDAPEWTETAEESNALRTSLAHWKVFAEHAEGERSRLKHNEAVMMDALYKACGDDEEMVRQIIESQGVLRPDPALLASGGA